ncbi:MAG: hypothetical protein BroJett011_14280 [Chloroflexota bacterium]|nr:MAG: hypothetical protein BroJett011_14280 [Chloroflexota bacterium]
MNTLKYLVEKHKRATGLSYEKMAYHAGLSRNQFVIIVESGLSDGTSLKTIRGIAKLLDMQSWELLKVLEQENG